VGRTHLQGYVSSLYSLALYVKELNYKGLNIAGVFTTAEQLPLEQAEFMAEVFKCDIKSFFGCAEINCLGFQTQMHGPYIIPEEIVFIETSDQADGQQSGKFLLTSLFNYKTPLIRYLNGDVGILKMGNKYLTITELSGRSADMFLRRDGSLISSIVATQTMQLSGLTHKIKRYQFIQHSISKIEFRYEPFNDCLTQDELEKILYMYKKRFGDEFVLTPVETREFVKSSNGKHRLMVKMF